LDEEKIDKPKIFDKKNFNLIQWGIRPFIIIFADMMINAVKLTYICIRDKITELLPFSIGMALISPIGIIVAIYGGFYIESEDKSSQSRNKFRWTVNSIINGFSILCAVITIYVYIVYSVLWSDYAIAVFAGFIGLFFALTFNNILDNIRRRDRRDRLLQDIYFELKENSAKLVGKGYHLNNDVWDSGKSAGLIQELTSYQLRQLSTIYHYLDTTMREADYCRQAGEEHSMIPAIESRRKEAAKQRFEKLSKMIETRETELRKRIDALLNEDFWEKAGVRENEV